MEAFRSKNMWVINRVGGMGRGERWEVATARGKDERRSYDIHNYPNISLQVLLNIHINYN